MSTSMPGPSAPVRHSASGASRVSARARLRAGRRRARAAASAAEGDRERRIGGGGTAAPPPVGGDRQASAIIARPARRAAAKRRAVSRLLPVGTAATLPDAEPDHRSATGQQRPDDASVGHRTRTRQRRCSVRNAAGPSPTLKRKSSRSGRSANDGPANNVAARTAGKAAQRRCSESADEPDQPAWIGAPQPPHT